MIEVAAVKYHKRDFWIKENLNYAKPHFRMEKAARLVNRMARGIECDLLDVGCGPATLGCLLDANVRYHGIDIAIHDPAPNLVEIDFVENAIRFGEKKFDLVVAQGVFEYIGKLQDQKLGEIAGLLNAGGKFIVSYVNFNHRNWHKYWPYNNIQPFSDFRMSLEQFFSIDRFFPTSQRWHHDEPRTRLKSAIQMHINFDIPLFSRIFAVEYFFICSARKA